MQNPLPDTAINNLMAGTCK